MKNLYLLIMFAVVYTTAAQQFEWLKTPVITNSNNLSGLGYSVTTDPSGNVFMTGYKSDAFNYTDVFGTVGIDKYNAAGTLLWSRSMGGHAIVYDTETDNEGNLLMAAGYVTSITIGDFGLVTINQGVQFLALKFDAQGNMLWYHELGADNPFLNDFRSITTDTSGNVYAAYDDYGDAWITKLSASGSLLFTIEQEDTSRITSVSVDSSGNIYAAGTCANQDATFNGVAAPTSFQYNTYVVKYSPAGVYQWHHYVDDITCGEPQVVAVDENHVYFSSYLFGAYAFGPFVAEGPVSGGFSDFFIAKLDGLGEYQWVREVPGTGVAHTGERSFIDADAQGNVYFAGSTQGNVNWGNGISTSSPNFQNNGVLLKYAADGNILAAVTYGGSNNDRSDAVTVTDDGVYITAVVHGAVQFGTIDYNGGAQYYPILTKVTGLPLGISESSADKIVFYPNPAADVLFSSAVIAQPAIVYDMLGHKVLEVLLGGGQVADMSRLSEGMYIISANNISQRLLIKR